MKKQLLLLSFTWISIVAMDHNTEEERFTSHVQHTKNSITFASPSDYFEHIINTKNIDTFSDAFDYLPIHEYSIVIECLKNYLAKETASCNEFVYNCHAFMSSFIRNQEKPTDMDDETFEHIRTINTQKFNELICLLTQNQYDTEASIEPGSDERDYE